MAAKDSLANKATIRTANNSQLDETLFMEVYLTEEARGFYPDSALLKRIFLT